MKVDECYIVWKEHSAECWPVLYGRNSRFTIPNGYHFMPALGEVSKTRTIYKNGETKIIKASQASKIIGMLGLFRHIIIVGHVDAEAVHCAFMEVDEYLTFITPFGHTYKQWYG
jgi:hypothetical protein